MTGVTIGGYHCYDDLKMILARREIGLPEPQVYTVEIPGRNGILDLTDALFDGCKFNNRELALTFVTLSSLTGNEWTDFLSEITEILHGQKLQIIFDEDPDYYYLGRCSINSFETNCYRHEVEVACDCAPYKYKLSETTVELTLTAETAVTLSNEQMPAIPTIVTDGEITITYEDSSLVLSEGEWIATDLTLAAGETEWTITPTDTATVTITYQEGRL